MTSVNFQIKLENCDNIKKTKNKKTKTELIPQKVMRWYHFVLPATPNTHIPPFGTRCQQLIFVASGSWVTGWGRFGSDQQNQPPFSWWPANFFFFSCISSLDYEDIWHLASVGKAGRKYIFDEMKHEIIVYKRVPKQDTSNILLHSIWWQKEKGRLENLVI